MPRWRAGTVIVGQQGGVHEHEVARGRPGRAARAVPHLHEPRGRAGDPAIHKRSLWERTPMLHRLRPRKLEQCRRRRVAHLRRRGTPQRACGRPGSPSSSCASRRGTSASLGSPRGHRGASSEFMERGARAPDDPRPCAPRPPCAGQDAVHAHLRHARCQACSRSGQPPGQEVAGTLALPNSNETPLRPRSRRSSRIPCGSGSDTRTPRTSSASGTPMTSRTALDRCGALCSDEALGEVTRLIERAELRIERDLARPHVPEGCRGGRGAGVRAREPRRDAAGAPVAGRARRRIERGSRGADRAGAPRGRPSHTLPGHAARHVRLVAK